MRTPWGSVRRTILYGFYMLSTETVVYSNPLFWGSPQPAYSLVRWSLCRLDQEGRRCFLLPYWQEQKGRESINHPIVNHRS